MDFKKLRVYLKDKYQVEKAFLFIGDAELVLHTILEKENYDKAIIISSDGDFHCLIDYLIDNDKLEIVGIPNEKKYSSFLKQEKIKPFLRFLSRQENKLKK